jgi:hypothetical protein
MAGDMTVPSPFYREISSVAQNIQIFVYFMTITEMQHQLVPVHCCL